MFIKLYEISNKLGLFYPLFNCNCSQTFGISH